MLIHTVRSFCITGTAKNCLFAFWQRCGRTQMLMYTTYTALFRAPTPSQQTKTLIFRKALTFCTLLTFFNSVSVFSEEASNTPEQLRQIYLDARIAMDKNKTMHYQQLKNQLINYPLYPYLEYQELNKQLDTYPYKKVDNFLDKYTNTYLGHLMLRNWLSQLAASKRWHEYRSYFDEKLNSATHQCLFLWSRYQTGDKTALEEVETLWNVGKSQPDDCDALFSQWQQAGYLTEDLIWERYVKASLNRETSLIHHLKRLMSQKTRSMAVKFQQVLKNPSMLENTKEFKNTHPYTKTIVLHGLNKFIQEHSAKAWPLWKKYESEYSFSDLQKNAFIYALTKRHAYDYEPENIKPHLSSLTQEQHTRVVEIIIREALKESQWLQVDEWIAKLPDEQKLSERWQYWQARCYEALGKSKEIYLPIYQKLSKERSFYGFLSADYLDQDYNLQHSPTLVEAGIRNMLEARPSFMRARELFFLDKLNDARQEWAFATTHAKQALSPEEYQAAAQMAYDWGWHRKSIESMAAASAWDDLTIRFPVVHGNIIQQQAKKTKLPETLLLAIARQESAWETDARSSAGAMGLMQLMPQTARETAKKAGIVYKRDDLLEPEHNIILGSRYISELLKQYDNNRVPAIAAYNAGPHRVNRWLEKSDRQLPHDIWIEVIPFSETRKYVQNVLSYAVVYSHQLGNDSTLLTQVEVNRQL